MAADPSQLYLLADHIKLSLLERQRATSLNLGPNTQDAEISRSLDSFRAGLEALEARSDLRNSEEISQLRAQFSDLSKEFDGTRTVNSSTTASHLNNASLSPIANQAAQSTTTASNARTSKSVRFRDDPSAETDEAARAKLFPYSDDPSQDDPPDHSHLDNQQIQQYHTQVLQDQDEQLDRLGTSIGRQRELSMAIGDELDEQAQLLDDVDDGVTRHQSQIDRARKRIGKIARKAKDNLSLTIILSLILILILLIIITK